jgi:molybdopterin-guanine dinucleotide biosynthesis protein A
VTDCGLRMPPAFSFSSSGVVIAGGHSRRMGRDKALIEVDGRALWCRQYELLAAANCSQRLISARADQEWVPASGLRIEDARPDCGPLGGLVAALRVCTGSHLVTLAVDLPRLPLEWILRLRALCAPGLGAVGRRAGRFEPLAAIYPREILTEAEDALKRGKYSLQALLELGVAQKRFCEVTITDEERAWFENWNEPSDLGIAQS